MKETVKCAICGESFKIITYKHLKHHNITLPEYKKTYPDAPTQSEAAIHLRKKIATETNSSRIGIPRSEEVINKIKLSKKNNPVTAWNKGIPMTKNQKVKLSETKKRQFASGEIIHWNTGNVTSDITKDKTRNTLLSQNLTMSEESKIKRKNTLQVKRDNGWVPDTNPEKIRSTQLERYGCNYNQLHISPLTLENLKDKEWIYDQHITQRKSLLLISKELNIGDGTVARYLHSHDIETQHYLQSTGENEVNKFVNSLGIPTIQGTRNIIPPLELDIYIPEHKLAIEYCGLYWHSEAAGKDKNYHKLKYDMCVAHGIQLITIFEDEWQFRKEQVKGKLKSLLNVDDRVKVYARLTNIVNVDTSTKKEFFEINHIQGDGNSSINLGLEYNGKLVACMAFTKIDKFVYVLNRYATNSRVVGGFSKILKFFKNTYQWEKIISFADLRWSSGNLYSTTGWKLDKVLPPDYSYCPDNITRYHKFNYRRKNLAKILKEFDSSKSERVNCDNNGILRIWDCGKLRYVITQ